MIEVRFIVHDDTLPALYSAIEEISNSVGARMQEPHAYKTEDALTRASRALGPLRAGIAAAHRELAQLYPQQAARWASPLGDSEYR